MPDTDYAYRNANWFKDFEDETPEPTRPARPTPPTSKRLEAEYFRGYTPPLNPLPESPPTPASDSPLPPSLPPLSLQDEAVVLALILNNHDVFAAAGTTNLTPTQLIAYSTRPHIAAYLAAERALTKAGLERQALTTLARVLNPPPYPTKQLDHHNQESRRSATNILRHLRQPTLIRHPRHTLKPLPDGSEVGGGSHDIVTQHPDVEAPDPRATEMSSSRCSLSPFNFAPTRLPLTLHTTAGTLRAHPPP